MRLAAKIFVYFFVNHLTNVTSDVILAVKIGEIFAGHIAYFAHI